MSYFLYRSVTSNLGNLLTWRQLIWIENGRNIARNNCLLGSKLPKLEVTDQWKYDIHGGVCQSEGGQYTWAHSKDGPCDSYPVRAAKGGV